ncbi:family 16 glycoside hydrolase [Rhodoferax ferrireducens]|uniref:family 16 glycoside hydrolase n=1 Tax=Rhodoferax ferrireducens TaxID=192843 RepID=UPI000E0DC265|nr:family 16 glycoside hydrolase [Rhodoferax ferrireducens]
MPLNSLVDSGIRLPPPDIQRTTFSIDGLARLTCNTWEEILGAQAGSEFDVVIVGSGMYGAYAAAKLFELGRRMERELDAPRVLVLESGPFLITEHIQNIARRDSGLGATVAEDLVDPGQTNEPSLVKHSRCVGGKSMFWGGWAPRYQAEDMQRVDAAGDRLWPQEVETYLFQTGYRGGYEYSEKEIGAYPVQDFIKGPLYDALKAIAENVVTSAAVPSLKVVVPPPIAVQGEAPGSGLFSFDKYSSVSLLHDSLREDAEISNGDDAARRLFLVPCSEVLRLETVNGRVQQIVVALADPAAPRDKSRARVVRLNLKSSAMIVLAGNTINSTRLALNSFPRPAPLNVNGELMGRNLMFHSRSNFVWRVKRSAMGLPPPDPANITTAALHITGSAATTGSGVGQFHLQFYAAPSMDAPMFPGAGKDPERFLYQMAPNIEDVESIREAQTGLGNDRVAIGIRTVGETFGDRVSPIASNLAVSWMNVSPFGGSGDDVYFESGNALRIPKAYVHLVKTSDDDDVQAVQDAAAVALINAMANVPAGGGGPAPAPAFEVIAQVPVNVIPINTYRTENTTAGRMFVGSFGGQFRVVDGTCTHEGCFVSWFAGQNQFDCPCHAARFAADGMNISGPPQRPLDKPGFRIQGANLEILRPISTEPVGIVSGGSDGIGTSYHEAGTLWLGTDFTKSVTDVNGRFHHVTNAYCIDQSIFPSVGSANPVLTGISLSRKIAQSMIDRYVSADNAAPEAGFTSLYTGNFAADGWQMVPGGGQNFFDVADADHPVLGVGVDNPVASLGVLRYSVKTFKDFILKLDWKAYDVAANSGIFLRMPTTPLVLDGGFYDSTIEVQIDEHGYDAGTNVYGSPLHKTGAVYEVFPARLWAAKVVHPRGSGRTTFWNSCEITLQGTSIEVKLNGLPVSKGEFPNLLTANAPSLGKTKRDEGFIGLQCHTEVVQFRNIRIKEL